MPKLKSKKDRLPVTDTITVPEAVMTDTLIPTLVSVPSPVPSPITAKPLYRVCFMLRPDTVNLVEKYQPEAVYITRVEDAKLLPKAKGAIRILVAASLDEIKGFMAAVPPEDYEGIADDLEGWDRTPVYEQEHPVETFAEFFIIAHAAGKKFYGVPGLKFMDAHNKMYAKMAYYTDYWIIQAQRRQIQHLPSIAFQISIGEIVNKIKAGKEQPIWCQLSVTPGGYPINAPMFMDYRQEAELLVYGFEIFDFNDVSRPTILTSILKSWKNPRFM
jgi:hypothetical protein